MVSFIVNMFCLNAQLDSIHYLPPLRNAHSSAAINEQRVYFSTPESTPFTIELYLGSSATPFHTITGLAKGSPKTYNPGNGDNDILLLTKNKVGVVQSNAGLRIESTNGAKFYVNYRGRSSSQAGSLTSKGTSAKGTDFRWGGLPNKAQKNGHLNSVLGILATENGTTVEISGYNTSCEFRLQNNASGILDNNLTISLDAGQSFVLEALPEANAANIDGWIGASVTSNLPIVVSSGGLNCGVIFGAQSRDVAIDQSVPIEKLGREYVFVRGKGIDALEFPLIIGVENNTDVFVGGTYFTTINDGDYVEIPGSNYSTSSVGGNMYVETSKPVYAYQSIAGQSAQNTGGMNFVAPLNCLLPSLLDEISAIDDIAGLVSGVSGITIIASSSTLNSNIVVSDDNGVIALPSSSSVLGTSDWKTFYLNNLSGEVSVISTGNIAVGVFMSHGSAAGLGGYFSGFDTAPNVELEIVGTGCFPGGTIQELSGTFDAYQWVHDGSDISGANSFNYTPASIGDYSLLVTKGTCSYSSGIESLFYCDYDLQISKVDDNDPIHVGENTTYTVEAKNNSVHDLTGVIISENIPPGFSIVSVSLNKGVWNSNEWSVGTLSAGEIAKLELTLTPDNSAAGADHTNTVSTLLNEVDANLTLDDPIEVTHVISNLAVDAHNLRAEWAEDMEGAFLSWETFSEQNNLEFVIYRMSNDSSFIPIGVIPGNGNSSEVLHYEFYDSSVRPHLNHYYQYEQIDFDGKSTFSDVVYLESKSSSQWKIYPNPANNYLTIKGENKFGLVLSSFDGKKIDLNAINVFEDQSVLILDVRNLEKGLYFVQNNNCAEKIVIH